MLILGSCLWDNLLDKPQAVALEESPSRAVGLDKLRQVYDTVPDLVERIVVGPLREDPDVIPGDACPVSYDSSDEDALVPVSWSVDESGELLPDVYLIDFIAAKGPDMDSAEGGLEYGAVGGCGNVGAHWISSGKNTL
jgi:hypothetical protein